MHTHARRLLLHKRPHHPSAQIRFKLAVLRWRQSKADPHWGGGKIPHDYGVPAIAVVTSGVHGNTQSTVSVPTRGALSWQRASREVHVVRMPSRATGRGVERACRSGDPQTQTGHFVAGAKRLMGD